MITSVKVTSIFATITSHVQDQCDPDPDLSSVMLVIYFNITAVSHATHSERSEKNRTLVRQNRKKSHRKKF